MTPIGLGGDLLRGPLSVPVAVLGDRFDEIRHNLRYLTVAARAQGGVTIRSAWPAVTTLSPRIIRFGRRALGRQQLDTGAGSRQRLAVLVGLVYDVDRHRVSSQRLHAPEDARPRE